MTKGWVGSLNTPDWTDCMIAMKAVQDLHAVILIVSVSTGVFAGPVGYTTISAFKHEKQGEASILGPPITAISGEWPCKDHKDYYACLLSAIYSVDSALSSQCWEQKNLLFTEGKPPA